MKSPEIARSFADNAGEIAFGHCGELHDMAYREITRSHHPSVTSSLRGVLLHQDELGGGPHDCIVEQVRGNIMSGNIPVEFHIGDSVDNDTAVINPTDFGLFITMPNGIVFPPVEKIVRPNPESTEVHRKNRFWRNSEPQKEGKPRTVLLYPEPLDRTAFALGNVDAIRKKTKKSFLDYLSQLSGIESQPDLGLRQDQALGSGRYSLHGGREAPERYSYGLVSSAIVQDWIKALTSEPDLIRQTRLEIGTAAFNHEGMYTPKMHEMHETVDYITRERGKTTVSTVIVSTPNKANVYINPSHGGYPKP